MSQIDTAYFSLTIEQLQSTIGTAAGCLISGPESPEVGEFLVSHIVTAADRLVYQIEEEYGPESGHYVRDHASLWAMCQHDTGHLMGLIVGSRDTIECLKVSTEFMDDYEASRIEALFDVARDEAWATMGRNIAVSLEDLRLTLVRLIG